MIEYQLTDMHPDDVPQAAQLWSLGWHDGHADVVPKALARLRTLDSFQERLKENVSATRIGRSGADVLGFCITHDDEIYQMYVSGQARGSGLAQALMADAERKMLDAGHQSAWLACAIGNNRAARFYEKSGWINARTEEVALDTKEGVFPLSIWRFEKQLRG
jgi:GNAT superfamily N-acetyltransferase